jgi:hypothetical protein
VSDPNDSSIPVLSEILVPGNPAQARHVPGGTQPVSDPETAQEPVFAPAPRHEPEPVLRPESAPAREEPTLAPQPAHVSEQAHPADHAHPKKRSRAHHAGDHRHAHEPAVAPSAGVFDRAEPHAPIETGAIVPPDIAHEALAQPQPNLDADVIAERLRGRFAGGARRYRSTLPRCVAGSHFVAREPDHARSGAGSGDRIDRLGEGSGRSGDRPALGRRLSMAGARLYSGAPTAFSKPRSFESS